jgi:branched-subunit amino acid ABC-type transport system permease component
VFKYSFLWRVFKWIYENSKVVSSLGLNVNKLILVGAMFFFLLLLLSSYWVIANSNVKATDGIFYLLKGLGIMIIVWVSAIEYTFLWALLYVLVEYILFVELWLPISYKETFILVIVLCILVFKPNGLFTFAKRKL